MKTFAEFIDEAILGGKKYVANDSDSQYNAAAYEGNPIKKANKRSPQYTKKLTLAAKARLKYNRNADMSGEAGFNNAFGGAQKRDDITSRAKADYEKRRGQLAAQRKK